MPVQPEADRTTLIRRVTVDLAGLPPTLQEVEAFPADQQPGAWECVVDRLLQSPHYGEQMGRLWLDVARYGNTHGLHLDNGRQLCACRDWVTAAFNRNAPWDQLTVDQLAGDLIPNATQELSGRILGAVETVEDLYGDEHCEGASRVKSVTADKGYHAAGELAVIQHETGARTVTGDAQAARRRLENLEPEMRAAVQKASRAVRSQSGKDLLRQRGEKIKRGFAHTLDSGGLRLINHTLSRRQMPCS
jgi:hypothetical protein